MPGPDPDLTEPGIEIPDSVEEIVILGDSTSESFLIRCTIARAAARWARPGRTIAAAWCWIDADFDNAGRNRGRYIVLRPGGVPGWPRSDRNVHPGIYHQPAGAKGIIPVLSWRARAHTGCAR